MMQEEIDCKPAFSLRSFAVCMSSSPARTRNEFPSHSSATRFNPSTISSYSFSAIFFAAVVVVVPLASMKFSSPIKTRRVAQVTASCGGEEGVEGEVERTVSVEADLITDVQTSSALHTRRWL